MKAMNVNNVCRVFFYLKINPHFFCNNFFEYCKLQWTCSNVIVIFMLNFSAVEMFSMQLWNISADDFVRFTLCKLGSSPAPPPPPSLTSWLLRTLRIRSPHFFVSINTKHEKKARCFLLNYSIIFCNIGPVYQTLDNLKLNIASMFKFTVVIKNYCTFVFWIRPVNVLCYNKLQECERAGNFVVCLLMLKNSFMLASIIYHV